MPFTFSHPAILLPLRFLNKNYFSITGLIMGSMVPDFYFLLQMRTSDNFSHEGYGILLLNLPLAIVLCVIFHNIVKQPLVASLPNVLQKKCMPFYSEKWNHYFLLNSWKVLLSIVIGVFSHLFWDSFTHSDGYFVEHIAYLNHEVLSVPMYELAQYLFSILGLVMIVRFVRNIPTQYSQSRGRFQLSFWISFVIIAISIFVLRFVFLPVVLLPDDIILSAFGSLIYALLLNSIVFRWKSYWMKCWIPIQKMV